VLVEQFQTARSLPKGFVNKVKPELPQDFMWETDE
jgi:hypothetical protein